GGVPGKRRVIDQHAGRRKVAGIGGVDRTVNDRARPSVRCRLVGAEIGVGRVGHPLIEHGGDVAFGRAAVPLTLETEAVAAKRTVAAIGVGRARKDAHAALVAGAAAAAVGIAPAIAARGHVGWLGLASSAAGVEE